MTDTVSKLLAHVFKELSVLSDPADRRWGKTSPANRKLLTGFMEGYRDIVPFDFGGISLIPTDEFDLFGSYGEQRIRHSKFQLPFPVVGYCARFSCGPEFMLAFCDDTGVDPGETMYMHVLWAAIRHGRTAATVGSARFRSDHGEGTCEIITGDGNSPQFVLAVPPADPFEAISSAVGRIVSLTAMLSSKGARAPITYTPSPDLNAKRERKRLFPLHEVRSVVIDVDGTEYPPNGHATGTHASPRLHWRRSMIAIYSQVKSRSFRHVS